VGTVGTHCPAVNEGGYAAPGECHTYQLVYPVGLAANGYNLLVLDSVLDSEVMEGAADINCTRERLAKVYSIVNGKYLGALGDGVQLLNPVGIAAGPDPTSPVVILDNPPPNWPLPTQFPSESLYDSSTWDWQLVQFAATNSSNPCTGCPSWCSDGSA